jgi:tetratricopeptide (TPR) repeat protein
MKTFALYVAFLQFCCSSWFDLGLEYQWSGKPEKAVICFSQIKSTSQNYYAANLLKSVIMWGDLRKREDAIKNLDEGIKINPNEIKAWLNKAQVLKDFDEYEESNACYDKAFEIDPNNDSVWYGKASLFYKWGNYKKSIKWCNKVINKDPISWAAFKIKGDSYYEQGKYKQAYKAYNMASQYNKRDIETKLFIANTLYMQGSYLEAKDQYSRLEKLLPNNGYILYGKAMSLIALDNLREANKILNILENNPNIYGQYNEFLDIKDQVKIIDVSTDNTNNESEIYKLSGEAKIIET